MSGAQQIELIKSAAAVGPLELTRLLRAITAKDEKTGLALVAALKNAKGLRGLSESGLRAALTPFPQAVKKAGDAKGKTKKKPAVKKTATKKADVAKGESKKKPAVKKTTAKDDK